MMIGSNIISAATAVRVICLLYILFYFLVGHVAIAARTSQPSRNQLQHAMTIRQESSGQAAASPTTDLAPRANDATTLPFTLPTSIVINQLATIGIQWPTDNSVSMVVLCQTSATDISLMTSDNTWVVLSVDFSVLGINTANPAGSMIPVPMTFEIPPEAAANTNFQNFFFCWGFEPTGSSVFECETYSETFDVQTSLGSRRAVQWRGGKVRARIPQEVTLLPRVIGTPTAPLTISQSSIVLSIQASPTASALQPNTPSSTITTVIQSISTKYVTEATSGAPTSASSANSTVTGPSIADTTTLTTTTTISSKGLPTGAKIGIGVALPFVAILILVSVALCYLRRRKDSNEVPLNGKDIFNTEVSRAGHTTPAELPSAPYASADGDVCSEADGNAIHESDSINIFKRIFELSDTKSDATGSPKRSPFPPPSAREKLRAFHPSTKEAKMSLNAGDHDAGI